MEKKDPFAFRMSLTSLVIAIFTLIFTLYPSEVRSILGNGELKVTMSEKMVIENNIHGVMFSPRVTFENSGYKSLFIEEIIIGVSNDNISHIPLTILNYQYKNGNTDTASPFELKPNHYFNAYLTSAIKLKQNELIERGRLNFKIGEDMSNKYIEDKDNLHNKIYISQPIVNEITQLLANNTKKYEAGSYYLYLAVKTNDKKLIWNSSYRFKLEQYMLDGITKLQSNSYRLPGKFDNQFMTYTASVYLNEEKDEKTIQKLAKAFEK